MPGDLPAAPNFNAFAEKLGCVKVTLCACFVAGKVALSLQVISIDNASSEVVLREVRKERKHLGWLEFRQFVKAGDGLVVHW